VGDTEVVREWAREFDVEELLRGTAEVRVEGKEDSRDEDEEVEMEDGNAGDDPHMTS
jgi:hypothetical protein